MNRQFQELITKLIAQCNGNQAEAARKMKVSQAFITRCVQGLGPNDPRSATWGKLYAALGESKPGAVRERGQAEYGDKFMRLAEWLRRQKSEDQEFILRIAQNIGFKDS